MANTVRAVVIYWCRVLVRAVKDTGVILQTNLRKLLIVAVITAVAVYFMYFVEGWTAAFAKVEWWLMLLVAEGVLFLLVFVLVFIKTPYILHATLNENLQQVKADLEKANDDAARAAAEHSQSVEKLNREHESSLNDNPKKRGIRGELENLRDGFVQVKRRLEAKDDKAIEGFVSQDSSAYNYIQKEINWYRQYGTRFPFRNTYTTKAKYDDDDFEQALQVCKDRLEKLEELIATYT